MAEKIKHLHTKSIMIAVLCIAISLCTFVSVSADDTSAQAPVISGGQLRAVKEKTTIAEFKASFTNPRSYPYYFYHSDGTQVESNYTGYIYTGMIMRYQFANSYEDYPVIVIGDVNGNGIIDIGDYTLIKSSISGITVLEGHYKTAADTNSNGIITATDFLRIKYHLTQANDLFANENYTADTFDDPDLSGNESGWTSGWYS